MNYFLLANNRNLKQSTIDKLLFNKETDLLVLFNFLFPFQFDKIKNYPNKICITRKRPIEHRLNSSILPGVEEYYCNIGNIREYQHLFKEIYLLPCPHNMGLYAQDYLNHINLYNFDKNKIKCINYDIKNMSKKLHYYRDGIKAEVSTGVIVNEYLQKIKNPEDNIILVAFNSDIDYFHDQNWETKYFLNQINQKKCLTIDCYNVSDTYNNSLQ